MAGRQFSFGPRERRLACLDAGLLRFGMPLKFEEKARSVTAGSTVCLLILHEISLAIGEAVPHIDGVFMGCFPCDTRLEAFPPYLSRVRS
jgi:hypothetical protein